MTKKNFKTAFDSLLEEGNKAKVISKVAEVRATFIVKSSHIEKLKAISYWERKMIKSIIDEALTNYITLYEKNNGALHLPK